MSTVLVVDDDRQLRTWLRTLLEAKGHRVLEAGEGNEGLARYDFHQPDLVVLDIYLPGKEGLETILLLRKKNPGVKILAVSGNLIEGYDVCRSAKAFGARDTLAKPFSAEVFLERVGRLLSC